MARLAVLTPLPPVRSDAAMAGASLVRLLRRSGRHDVSAPWPIPESVEALLGVTDLPVYHVTNDPEGREVYELAVERPGLVVLHDLALDRVVRGGLAAHDPVAMDSAREALATFDLLEGLDPGSALRMPWCSYLLRRARGVVVHSSFAARYLRALETRTPVFTAAPPAACDRRALRGARHRSRRLRASLGRGPVVGAIGETAPGTLGSLADAARGLGGRVLAFGSEPPEGTPGGVTRVGLPEERDLVAWLAACDVVAETAQEPTGTISTEMVRAIQLGVPVVAGSPRSLPDGVETCATLIEGSTEDVDALAAALERPLGDPALGERGRQALERAAGGAPAAYREAVERTLALVGDPLQWTLSRWGDALLDSGVTGDWVARGYGTAYTDALEELRPR